MLILQICCHTFRSKVFSILCISFLFTLPAIAQFNNETRWKNQNETIDYTIAGDFNGDGMTDIAYHISTNDTWKVMLSNGHGFDDPIAWCTGQAINKRVWAGDFNGDGLCDKISYVSTSSTQWKVALSGRETATTPPTTPNYRFYNESCWSTQAVPDFSKVLIADFNGDGRDDIAYYRYDNSRGGIWSVMKSNGGTFTTPGSFTSPTDWIQGFAWCNGTWAGDFNGDGRADIVSYVNLNDATWGGWWVGLSQPNDGFSYAGRWSTETANAKIDYAITGDFNGDGKCDIAYHIPNNGTYNDCWIVMTSTGTGFNPGITWGVGSAINSGVWAGDFNGDGYCDKVSQVNLTDPTWGGWWIAIANNPLPRQVGVWYSLWYPCTNSWSTTDSNKIPVVGWGTDTLSRKYYLADTSIIHKQVRAMKKAGIDFIVVDVTNGFPGTGLSYYDGDGCTTSKLTTLFNFMDGLNQSERIPMAVGLGFEFWGRYSMCGYKDHWDTWGHQDTLQQIAVNTIWNSYAYRPSYYKYLVKPLLIETFSGMLDYPFRNENYVITSRQIFPKFTVRYGCEWGATYTSWPDPTFCPDPACVYNANLRPFTEGTDSKRLWSYGAGAKDGSIHHDRPLPTSTELMNIMPGSYIWGGQNPACGISK